MPLDAYKCYLAMKNHFTKDNYDYHKYAGKVRATREAFYKRKDRFWHPNWYSKLNFDPQPSIEMPFRLNLTLVFTIFIFVRYLFCEISV